MMACNHLSIQTYTDAVTGEAHVWACAQCSRRFYPACETCVSVGHRNEIHVDPPDASLREAARPILDRALDVFNPDDLDPESSFAMPVTLKARWVNALRDALGE